jgi:hypothetical protein
MRVRQKTVISCQESKTSAPRKSASLTLMLVATTPWSLAFLKLVAVSFTLVRWAPSRVAVSFTLVRWAPSRLAPVKSEPEKSVVAIRASVRSAPARLLPVILLPVSKRPWS